MIACGSATFTDPEEYRARFPRAIMHLVLTGRGDFKARLTWVNLRRLSFIRVEESLPRVAFLSLVPGPLFIAFPIGNHLPALWNGQELGLGTILLHSNQGDRIYQRTDGPCHWGMISLSPKHLAAYARAVAHVDLHLPPTPELLRPTSGVATKLRRLHARTCRLAETKPDIVAHKQVARALEEDFLHALINCVLGVGRPQDRPPPQHYSVIMARFEDVLASHGHQHLSAPELCAAVGVSERTLRTCCAKFLRMSPLSYSRLRRLNLVGSTLRRTDLETATVAEVARRHGFSELGRFANHYREVFGETPSTTLRAARSVQHNPDRAVGLA